MVSLSNGTGERAGLFGAGVALRRIGRMALAALAAAIAWAIILYQVYGLSWFT